MRAEQVVTARSESDLDRILTIPNALSLARLVLVAVALLELFVSGERVLAAVLLAVAGSTDFLDGFFARRLHQVSTLGKILDPTVDRVVLGATVIAILVYGAVPWWIGGVVIGREALVSVATLAIAAAGARRIDVQFVGKAGTFALLAAFPLFLAGDGSGTVEHGFRIAAYVFALPGLVLSLIALVVYVPIAKRALAEGRAGRSGQ